jgi:phenylalanyl-tRNA synthetase beta chain
VVLESAYFHPTWIRKSARRHGLSTDASYRFERGIDPNGIIYALKQAAILCKELAGGKVSMQIKDVYPNPMEEAKVRLDFEYCDRLIGKAIGHETIKSIAESLEMKIVNEDAKGIDLIIPGYRVDVQRPCDVVEDILRIYGYNNVEIPSQLKSSLTVQGEEDKEYKIANLIGEQLVGCGFNEIMNNSLTKVAYYENAGLNHYAWENTVKVMNPLSADLGVMRQTLLFGGLESIVRNANRKNSNLKFFEFGNCYHFSPEKHDVENPAKAYTEENHLGLWVTGQRVTGSWAHPDEDSSFYELKAYVENVFRRVGLEEGAVVTEHSDNNVFSKGLAIKNRGGKLIAELGILSHKMQKQMDIDKEVYFAEINWTALMKAIRKNKLEYQEISKYPAVSRDLALLLDENVEFAQVVEVARQAERKLLKKVELFDVYQGKNLPAGKKSYAVNFILQDDTKTLNDKAIDAIMTKLINSIKNKLGAELR